MTTPGSPSTSLRASKKNLRPSQSKPKQLMAPENVGNACPTDSDQVANASESMTRYRPSLNESPPNCANSSRKCTSPLSTDRSARTALSELSTKNLSLNLSNTSISNREAINYSARWKPV